MGTRVAVTALAILLPLLTWTTPARAQPKPPAKTSAAADIAADLDEAIKLIEAGDFKTFIEKYAPVEELRSLRKNNELETAAKRMAANPEVVQKFVDLLKELKGIKPTYDKSGGVATFTAVEKVEKSTAPAAVPPAATVKLPAGWGGDVKQVIAACIEAVEKKDFKSVVEKMLPAGELARLQKPDQMEAYLNRFEAIPALGEQMLADLKQMQGQQPKIDGAVAEFGIPAADGKVRTIKLEKAGADWRFFDGGKSVAVAIQKTAALPLGTVEPGATVKAEMERIGGNWRFLKIAPQQ